MAKKDASAKSNRESRFSLSFTAHSNRRVSMALLYERRSSSQPPLAAGPPLSHAIMRGPKTFQTPRNKESARPPPAPALARETEPCQGPSPSLLFLFPLRTVLRSFTTRLSPAAGARRRFLKIHRAEMFSVARNGARINLQRECASPFF